MNSGINNLLENGITEELKVINNVKLTDSREEVDHTSFIYSARFKKHINFLAVFKQESIPDLTVLPFHLKEFSFNADVTSFYYSQHDKDFNPTDNYFQNAFNTGKTVTPDLVKKSVVKDNQLISGFKKSKDVTSIYYSNQLLNCDTIPFSQNAILRNNLGTSQSQQIALTEPKANSRNKNIDENHLYTELMLGIILIMIAVFAWARYYYNKYVPRIFETLFNYSLFSKLFRERNILSQNASRIYNFVFTVNTAIFLNQIVIYYNFNILKLSYYYTFVLFICLLFLIYILKTLLIRMLGLILDIGRTISEYIYSIQMINQAIGLLLFPVILAVPYINVIMKPVFLISGVIVVVIFYFIQIYRGIQIILNKQFSIFYMILYLCALEFIPVLLFVRLVVYYVK